MHEYDVAVKSILMGAGSALLTALTGADHLRWLNVETPKVSNLRVDMLGELPALAEYLTGIWRTHGRRPRQTVL